MESLMFRPRIRHDWIVLLLSCNLAFAGTAAPTVAVGNASGPASSSRTIGFSISSGSFALGGMQFELAVPSSLTALPGSASGPGGGVSLACSTPQTSRLVCLAFDFSGAPLPATFVINVNFMVNAGAAFGTVPLNLTDVQFSDTVGNNVPAGANSNGFFQILQAGPAMFSSMPAPDVLVDFGTVVHGSSRNATIRISNIAMPDFQALQVQGCSLSGSPAFALLQPSAFPVAVPAGSALDLIVQMVSVAELASEVQGTLTCQMTAAQAFNASWPLRAFPVMDLMLRNGFESP